MEHHRLLTDKLDDLLAVVATDFASDEVSEAREHIAIGEYALALETICNMIATRKTEISDDAKLRISELRELIPVDHC